MAKGNFAGGDGTSQNPYLIEDAFDLDSIRNRLDKCYKIIKDIDLNIAPFNEGNGWIPIGYNGNSFTGNLDGNGHKIKNLHINNTLQKNGIFETLGNSIIENLGVIDINVKGNGIFSGALFSCAYDSIIKNCFSTGVIYNNNDTVGGLFGTCYNTKIENSYSTVFVTGTKKYVGGLCGFIDKNSMVKNVYSSGKVINTTSTTTHGGLIGYTESKNIINSYWDIDNSCQSQSVGVGLSAEQMKNPLSFVDWDKEKSDNGKNIWILQNGKYPKLWFEKTNKYLVQDKNNVLYTLNGVDLVQAPSQILDENNFINNGFTDTDLITKDLLLSKFENLEGIKLLVYTDDLEKKECEMIYNCEPFRPIDKLKKNSDICNILFKEV
ncbi:hypothetical protein ACXAT3_002655 [Clostridium sporogenes]